MRKNLSAFDLFNAAKRNLFALTLCIFFAIVAVLLFKERALRTGLELKYQADINEVNKELIENMLARIELAEQLVDAEINLAVTKSNINTLERKSDHLFIYSKECMTNYILSRIENKKLRAEQEKFGKILKPSG